MPHLGKNVLPVVTLTTPPPLATADPPLGIAVMCVLVFVYVFIYAHAFMSVHLRIKLSGLYVWIHKYQRVRGGGGNI